MNAYVSRILPVCVYMRLSLSVYVKMCKYVETQAVFHRLVFHRYSLTFYLYYRDIYLTCGERKEKRERKEVTHQAGDT